MKVFLSHNKEDEEIVGKIYRQLEKKPGLDIFFWNDKPEAEETFPARIAQQIKKSKAFIFFRGNNIGITQEKELSYAILDKTVANSIKHKIVVHLTNAATPKNIAFLIAGISPVNAFEIIQKQPGIETQIIEIAEMISKHLPILDWEIPTGYPFMYEKDIIKAYIASKGTLDDDYVHKGCPKVWPEVERKPCKADNPIPDVEIGKYRDWDPEDGQEKDPQVLPAALTDFNPVDIINYKLTFPEAGPRKKLHFAPNPEKAENLRVGILVSGGISPGINAVIAGIVRRHYKYAEKGKYKSRLNIKGYTYGFKSLTQPGDNAIELDEIRVKGITNEAGSILGTSRAKEFMHDDLEIRKKAMESVINKLQNHEINILYIIGGGGSMCIAHALHKEILSSDIKTSIVVIPKTMDNDIFWVWQSFGFCSAVEQAREYIRNLYIEARSNPRLCLIQLFGSDSGFVASHAALASEVCDAIIIPESNFSMENLSNHIIKKLNQRDNNRSKSAYAVVVMAETAIPSDIGLYINDPEIGLTEIEKIAIEEYKQNGCRFFGETPDELRSAGLKVVQQILQRKIRTEIDPNKEFWAEYRVFKNEPRHLIRTIPPTSADTIICLRLGTLAVDAAMAGYTDVMISQWLTEYVMVPLRLVILGRKRIPKVGMFWKSVIADTGQPEPMG